MSNTKRTPSSRSAQRIEDGDLVYRVHEERLDVEFPGGQKATLSLTIDLATMFDLLEVAQQFDADKVGEASQSEALEMVAAVRTLIPAEFIEQTRGVDAALSLRAFMRYAEQLGERMGKAFT